MFVHIQYMSVRDMRRLEAENIGFVKLI